MPGTLMKGNEVIGAVAIRAGCTAFFGYPITPQTELPEYMAAHLPASGGVFVQAEVRSRRSTWCMAPAAPACG